jgi:hypothetical protein
VKASAWLATHPAGDRSLVQGLKVRLWLKLETICMCTAALS